MEVQDNSNESMEGFARRNSIQEWLRERINRFASKAIKWSMPVVEWHGEKNEVLRHLQWIVRTNKINMPVIITSQIY